jgi:hypothetical protein
MLLARQLIPFIMFYIAFVFAFGGLGPLALSITMIAAPPIAVSAAFILSSTTTLPPAPFLPFALLTIATLLPFAAFVTIASFFLSTAPAAAAPAARPAFVASLFASLVATFVSAASLLAPRLGRLRFARLGFAH